MYKQNIQLAPGEILELNWGKNFSNFMLYLNGQLIGSIPDKAALRLGQGFNLPGNRAITVILAGHGLEVWHNGTDLLTGIKSGTSDHFSHAANFLIGYGILQLIGASILVVIMVNRAFIIDFAVVAVLAFAGGGALIGLGIWAKKTGLNTPLKIAMGLLVLYTLSALFAFQIFGLIITSILIYYLYKGIQAGAIHKIPVQQQDEDGPLDSGV